MERNLNIDKRLDKLKQTLEKLKISVNEYLENPENQEKIKQFRENIKQGQDQTQRVNGGRRISGRCQYSKNSKRNIRKTRRSSKKRRRRDTRRGRQKK